MGIEVGADLPYLGCGSKDRHHGFIEEPLAISGKIASLLGTEMGKRLDHHPWQIPFHRCKEKLSCSSEPQLERFMTRQEGDQPFTNPVHLLKGHCREELMLVAEVVVERGLGQPRRIGNVLHRCFGEAALQAMGRAGAHQVDGVKNALGHAYGGGAQYFAMWIVSSEL